MISRHLQLISSQFSTVPLYTLVAAIHLPLRFLKPPAPPAPPVWTFIDYHVNVQMVHDSWW